MVTLAAPAGFHAGNIALMRAGRDLVALPAGRADCPSRVYAQPISLQVGQKLDPANFAQRLIGIGYRPTDTYLDRGTFKQTEDTIAVMLRPWPVPHSGGFREGARQLDLVLEHGRVVLLLVDGVRSDGPEPVALPLLATLYSDDLIECETVDLATLPEHVPLAILAAEDHSFYDHGGVSLGGRREGHPPTPARDAAGVRRRVEVAPDGTEGIDMLATLGDRVDVVLLDMTMPRMSGAEAFLELRKLRPDLPVVLMSGYDELEAVGAFPPSSLAGFLAKPFGPEEAAALLRHALGGGGTGDEETGGRRL